jgi:hypothetical protein
MAYIGKQPLVGNFTLLDALVATTTDTYALTKDTVAVFPQTPANCIVSLNGVIQAPFDSYTISGSDIVFDSALTGSDSIDFITVLGDVLNIGVPSDDTVTNAKVNASAAIDYSKLNLTGNIALADLSATGTKDATTFLRGDNTFAVPTDNGKVLQVVSTTNTTSFSTTSGTYQDGFSVSITPSSASNKILIMAQNGKIDSNTSGNTIRLGLHRDTTLLSTSLYKFDSANPHGAQTIVHLDSPSSTSSITYMMKFHVGDGGGFVVLNGGDTNNIIAMEIAG